MKRASQGAGVIAMTIEQQINGTDVDVVNQAAGILSVQMEVTLPEALEWMRTSAFVYGQVVAEFAADVVARRLSFGVGDREA
jgi:AmiR/NasT family two-component response regulator